MSVAEELTRVRSRIEMGWCQGASARLRPVRPLTPGDKETLCGRSVEPDDDRAMAWCLSGACAVERTSVAALRVLADALPTIGTHGGLIAYNDRQGRTKEQVLERIDAAIESVA